MGLLRLPVPPHTSFPEAARKGGAFLLKAGYLVDENVGAAWFQMPADRVWYTEETIGRLGGGGRHPGCSPKDAEARPPHLHDYSKGVEDTQTCQGSGKTIVIESKVMRAALVGRNEQRLVAGRQKKVGDLSKPSLPATLEYGTGSPRLGRVEVRGSAHLTESRLNASTGAAEAGGGGHSVCPTAVLGRAFPLH